MITTIQVLSTGAFWRVRKAANEVEVPFRTEEEALAHAIQTARNERPSRVEELGPEGRVTVVASYNC